jgi:hypothetical protein
MTIHGSEPIKFAYWVPNVSGGLVISNIEQRTSGAGGSTRRQGSLPLDQRDLG